MDIQAPSKIEPDAMAELETWADVDSSEEADAMAALGAQRNVLRYAEGWGPHLVALLSARGGLLSGGNPLEALERVLDASEAQR